MYSKDELAKQIGQKLQQAREEAGLSRADVGERLGLTERGYGHIEAGRSLIGVEYLLQLPNVLGKPVTYFLPNIAVSDNERDDVMLDPHLQAIVRAWPTLMRWLGDAERERVARSVTMLAEIIENHHDSNQILTNDAL